MNKKTIKIAGSKDGKRKAHTRVIQANDYSQTKVTKNELKVKKTFKYDLEDHEVQEFLMKEFGDGSLDDALEYAIHNAGYQKDEFEWFLAGYYHDNEGNVDVIFSSEEKDIYIRIEKEEIELRLKGLRLS